MQIDLPFTPLGQAMASRDAIQSWIRKNVLVDLRHYMQTGEVRAKRGIVHYFMDAMDTEKIPQAEVEQQIVVSPTSSGLLACTKAMISL